MHVTHGAVRCCAALCDVVSCVGVSHENVLRCIMLFHGVVHYSTLYGMVVIIIIIVVVIIMCDL